MALWLYGLTCNDYHPFGLIGAGPSGFIELKKEES